ncbi:hypothetical protein PV10_08517 [Exophiala mesophila]|uniref:DNA polymerase lambda n=1 Tax=Exophiala mesophila TaxID=212818 RepID=A0A0D1WJ21_EXOME|nr:uncharacterized protein PV10_08517 [Exophiala mesophila]KIV88885.1 hypothetical protein PV10_08517 [Exophiala mesophila]
MAARRKREEKEQFFRDLARLDDYIREDNDNDLYEQTSSLPQQRAVAVMQRAAPPNMNAPPTATIVIPSHESGNSQPSLNNNIVEISRSEFTSHNALKRKRPSSRGLSVPANARTSTAPEAVPASSPPIPTTKSTLPIVSSLRRTLSDQGSIVPKLRKGDKKLERIPLEKQIFHGLTLFFVPPTDDNPVRRFRIRKSIQYGATWANMWTDEATHIIVCDDLNAEKVKRYFKDGKIPTGPTVLRDQWLVESIKSRFLRETRWWRFQVDGLDTPDHRAQDVVMSSELGRAACSLDDSQSELAPDSPFVPKDAQGQPPAMSDDLMKAVKDVQDLEHLEFSPSFENTSTGADKSSQDDPALELLLANDKVATENKGFQCMEKHDGDPNDNNPNSRTIEILQQMATYYDRIGDHWRTTAYRKAMSALRKQKQLIRTKQEALAIPLIGKRLAEKIEEIVATDRLRRLEETQKDPHDQVLQLFMGIYGVGYPTASRWIAQGHRTLDDLRCKADLTYSQRVGVDHYEDFLQRIPRAEVAKHGEIVQKALELADPETHVIIGGSYRRGASDSGDIDLIITKEAGTLEHIRTLLVDVVIPRLTDQGFLKAALATGGRAETSSKWHGVSALPEPGTWRRIDFLFVPWSELGAALIYFTGNDIFNRSLRLLASRKKMRLNQHGLYADVLRGRGREKVTEGNLIESHDERRIFGILGVPYRPPEHRQC